MFFFSQELFNQLPKLGHAIMQWDLIGILLKYTLYSSLSSDMLLKLTKGPAYSRVRESFKKISSKIDQVRLINIYIRTLEAKTCILW